MMEGKEIPQTKSNTEETPRGELSDYTASKGLRLIRANVELAGALWDIEFNYLTLPEYIAHSMTDAGDVLTLRMEIARDMNPSLNGEPVDWETISPKLGLELAKYLDLQLNLPPSKNY